MGLHSRGLDRHTQKLLLHGSQDHQQWGGCGGGLGMDLVRPCETGGIRAGRWRVDYIFTDRLKEHISGGWGQYKQRHGGVLGGRRNLILLGYVCDVRMGI